MIIKGTEHSSAHNLARYLLTEKQNERCRLWDIRDSASDELAKSLTDWEMIGRCKTKGSKILYHAHIRLCDGERMHEARWYETIERLEEKLGLVNCPRAVVSHEHPQKGLHVHLVWSRYDSVHSKLVKLGNDHQQHHRVARQAEREFGLRPTVELDKTSPRRKRRLSDREVRAIKDRGTDREQLTKLLQAAWSATDGGQEMRAMLKSLKIDLVPGDRRDWVVQYKSLKLNPVRLLPEVNTASFRERMQDLDHKAEKQTQRDAESIKKTFRRKAHQMLKDDLEEAFRPQPKPRSGFRKASPRVPQPKLRRKLRYDDPGI
jgi:hypothetical protein